jgi:hypothetical protein
MMGIVPSGSGRTLSPADDGMPIEVWAIGTKIIANP